MFAVVVFMVSTWLAASVPVRLAVAVTVLPVPTAASLNVADAIDSATSSVTTSFARFDDTTVATVVSSYTLFAATKVPVTGRCVMVAVAGVTDPTM